MSKLKPWQYNKGQTFDGDDPKMQVIFEFESAASCKKENVFLRAFQQTFGPSHLLNLCGLLRNPKLWNVLKDQFLPPNIILAKSVWISIIRLGQIFHIFISFTFDCCI